ncbi:hypothetical protein LTR08_002356 [Meristemomyces frigidus]|nr:hypothetical protein LTR08_002356 [Meristemomyces frigidus]
MAAPNDRLDKADLVARLKKQKDEHAANKKEWSETIEGHEKTVEEANAALKKVEEEKRQLEKKARECANEAKHATEKVDELEREKEERAKDRSFTKNNVKSLEDQTKELKSELASVLSELKDRQGDLKQRQDQFDDARFEHISLHQELDNLRLARDAAVTRSDENNEAREALIALNTQFEQIFANLGDGLSIDDYLNHVRRLQSTSTLHRESSHTSISSELGELQVRRPRQSGNRDVSNTSIADELRGVESSSETDDDQEDQDQTITSGLAGGDRSRKWDVTHGDAPQSVRNPALPGQAEKVGEDKQHGEWQNMQTQTPQEWSQPAQAPSGAPINRGLPLRRGPAHGGSPLRGGRLQTGRPPVGTRLTQPAQQTLPFSGVGPSVGTAPIAPQAPTPAMPNSPTSPSDALLISEQTREIVQLKKQKGTDKWLLEERQKDRERLSKSNVDLSKEIKELKQQLETQRGFWAARAHSDEETIKQLRARIAQLEQDLRESQNSRDGCVEQKTNLESENQELKRKLGDQVPPATRPPRSTLNGGETVEELRTKVVELEHHSEEYLRDNDNLVKENTILEDAARDLEQKSNDACEEEKKKLSDEIEELKKKLSDAEKVSRDALAGDTAVAPTERDPIPSDDSAHDALRKRNEQLEEVLKEKEREVKRLRQAESAGPSIQGVAPTAGQNLTLSGVQQVAAFSPTGAPTNRPPTAGQNLTLSGTYQVATFSPTDAPGNRPPRLGRNSAPSGVQQVAAIPPTVSPTNIPAPPPPNTATPPGLQQPSSLQIIARPTATYTVPQTLADIFRALPWYSQLLLGLLLAAIVYAGWNLRRERNLWLGANDLTYREVVRLTGASSQDGWLMLLEEWLGLDRAGLMLG